MRGSGLALRQGIGLKHFCFLGFVQGDVGGSRFLVAVDDGSLNNSRLEVRRLLKIVKIFTKYV